MASRHDIINITFQANAGKANVALKTLQEEAKRSSDRVADLKRQLDEGLRANLPADKIQKIRDDIKQAEKEVRQWNGAYKDLTKGVRTLDEAIKQFNAGTLSQMNASFNKAAANAAKLAQTKMTPGTQEWKEMDALIVEAQSNVLKATADINGLVDAIKKGGTSSKSTLSQAKNDLEQLLTLEVRGSKEWKTYDAQLKVVTGELNKLSEAERKAAQADQAAVMSRRMKNLKTESSSGLAEIRRFWESMIAGAEKGSTELAKYEANLKKVTVQERKRKTESAEKILGNMKGYGVDQVRQATQEMERLRDSVVKGSREWLHWNKLVNEGNAYLKTFDEEAKIARGDAMSLSDALKLSSTAGGNGFSGTARQLQQAEQALQKAADAAKKGTPEWRKYQEALAKVRVEMNNSGMTSERMREILDKPANAKNLNELSAAVKRAKAELDLMAGTVGKNSKAYATLAEETKEAEIRLKELQAQAKGTATAWDKAWSRLKTYIGLYMGAAVAIQKITATMGDLLELSDKMGEVRKTTNLSAEAVGQLSRNLAKLDVRTPLTKLMEISAAAGQLGLKTTEDIQGFTEAANKLMIALPEMGKEAATEMMRVAIATGEVNRIRKQLQEGTLEGSSATAVAMEKIASTIDRLRASSASTAPEITDFVKRVGAVGAQSGISIDQVAALGSTISSLGMRVEMSATALSRMIPAIRNNAFAIANAIGVAPEALRSLFEAGRGMEAILMIFQHLKDQNANADTVESLLGIGNMKDVMKQLNQQGARAGIVFAGLSQNVDELRKQLVTANEAYEENVAITNEFNRMNDTTAAKWERLKNTLEEMFVGDTNQGLLGGIIEGLHELIKLIADTGPVATSIKTLIVTWAALKLSIGEGLKALGVWFLNLSTNMTKAATAMKALGKANWIGALLTAVAYLGLRFYEWANSIDIVANEMAKANEEIMKQTGAVDTLFHKLAKLREQERVSAISAAETAKAEEAKAKAMEQVADAAEDYAKKIGEAEQTEKKQADTEKAMADNMKNNAKAIKEETKAEEVRIAAEKKVQQQNDLIMQLEEKRASIMEFLNGQHLKEVVVTGSRAKAMDKLRKQNDLINQLEERRAGIMDFLNQKQMQEVVIIGDRTKSMKKLWQQNDLIMQLEKRRAEMQEFLNQKQLKEVVVTGSRAKAMKNLEQQNDLIAQLEERRAATMEFLNQKYLKEVVVTGSRAKAMKNLREQNDLIAQLDQRRAETMEFLNGQYLQEVVVTGDRTKSLQKMWKQNDLIVQLEEKRAGIMDFLNQKQLQEVVVIGDRTKSLKKLWEQNDLIAQVEQKRLSVMEFLNQRQLQEVVVTGSRAKAMKNLTQQNDLIMQLEQKRAGIMEFLNQKQLQEVVIIGDRSKALKNLQQQNDLIAQVEEKRASVMEFLNSQQLKEVVVTGNRAKAIEHLRQQNDLINQMEERRSDIMDFLNQKQLQEIVVIGSREKAVKNLAQQNDLIAQIEERRASIMDFLTKKQEADVAVTEKRTRTIEELRKQNDLINQLEEKRASIMDFLNGNTKKLSESTEGLAEAEKKTAEQAAKVEEGMHRVNIEGSKSASIIREINSKYGTYLGYMISETSSAQQLAAARDLINKKLRETITLKQQEAAMGSVEQEFGGNVNKRGSKMDKRIDEIFGNNYEAAARVSVAISEAAQKYTKDTDEYEKAVRKIVSDNFKYIDRNGQIAKQFSDDVVQDRLTDMILDRAKDYREAIEEYQHETDVVNRRFEATTNINRKNTREAVTNDLNTILADWKNLVGQYRKAEGEEKEKLAAEVYKQQRAYVNAVANNAEYFEGDKRKDVFERNIKNMQTYEEGLRKVAGEAIRTIDAMERAETKITGVDYSNGGESVNNPWGGGHDAASTDWKNMTANQLVERRKQMKDFVNAIQTDTDVQSVLKEDAALKKAIENGMSSDMRTVIEWYNTERLKIQDELHARHLTNTGDWLDPKQRKNAHKQFQAEVQAYLDELDAYYTERNQEIQTARNNEEITEAEAWRRTVNNETEWYNRRAELQKLYSEKSAEVAKEEQDAIFAIIAERTGDSEKFIRQMIGKTIQFAKQIEKTGEKGAAMVHKWRAGLDLGTEKDFLKSAKAFGRQVKFIEDTLAKERPYDSITKNLQENLDKMGVLAARYKHINDELLSQGKERKYSDAEITAQTYQEMAFYLKQAENAWSIDIDELLQRMAQDGMAATAEEIGKSELLKQAVMGQLRKTFEEVQNAVKKEASQIRKDVDILWNDDTRGPGGMSMKAAYDKAIAGLGMQQDSVSRANSLIGAGPASENVVARLAMKQAEMQMRMQKAQFDMYRVQASQRMEALKREAAEHRRLAALAEKEGNITEKSLELLKAENAERDAANVKKSLGLTLAEETKKEEENIANLLKLQEESQNRLYQSLKEWGELLASSMREVMEASNAGNAEYYNELAKMNLTGKGGPGAGTYIVIDNEGTKDAEAHYEHLSEREALERQHEIEVQNAQAEAWSKVMDDINMKMSEQITDWINASLQNASIDANTDATLKNTEAIVGLTESVQAQAGAPDMSGMADGLAGASATEGAAAVNPAAQALSPEQVAEWTEALGDNPMLVWMEQSDLATKRMKENNDKITKSTQSAFAKMTQAANLYGIAYQAMSNDNLSAAQKFEMIALQAVGQGAIAALTTNLAQTEGEVATQMPGILGKAVSQLGPIAGPAAFAVLTGILGGLMGMAVSKIAKSKSQIAQVTGASASAGKLTTGMLAYAEGNVNEFTDPDTLTPGRSYNVDGADGKTYRAKYTGKDARTHVTSGPEFHLVGEKGQEAIIDAHTTRNIRLNEPEIWHSIQTLYNGGRLSATRRRGRGVRAFADGNLDDFGTMEDGRGMMENGGMDLTAIQGSLDRNTAVQEALLERLNQPIVAQNILYGPDGLPNVIAKLQKEAKKHGEKYL